MEKPVRGPVPPDLKLIETMATEPKICKYIHHIYEDDETSFLGPHHSSVENPKRISPSGRMLMASTARGSGEAARGGKFVL